MGAVPIPRREGPRRWLLALGCFGLLGFFFSPPFGAFLAWSRTPELRDLIEVRRGASVLEQAAHPGAPLRDPLHAAIQWRLLFPVIGHVLGLPGPALFALAPLGCLCALAFIITVLRRQGMGWTETAAAAVVLGAGAWYFTSLCWLGYYDSWLVLALLLTAFARTRRAVWAACLWAPWVDERFVLAAPLALCCRHLWPQKPASAADWKKEYGVPAALILAFVAVRLGILGGRSAPMATVSGYLAAFHPGAAPFGRLLFGAWSGLRLGWLLVIAAVALAAPRSRPGAALAALVALVLVAGLATAQDLGRSMMLEAPAALLGALLLAGSRPSWLRRGLLAAAAAALLLPAHLVVSNRVNPVFYLYHELAALDHPAGVGSPEFYELQGMLAMQQGDYGAAEADFTMAIRFGDKPASAYQQRGLLRATENRLAEAREDFTEVTREDPRNPDGWFYRAHADLALGEAGAALSDFQQARAVGSESWQRRPDVAQFAAGLGRQTGRP